jgi:putative pyruvate formate lyase activating enzyme
MADRVSKLGYCKAPLDVVVSSAMVHTGEEAIISGYRGSGTVFFSGCNLGCVFCQNYDISQSCSGITVSISELAEIFMNLQSKGVHNINLVTPSHFVSPIVEAIRLAKKKGIKIPFVYNSNGYDSLESLEMLDGLIDIYMPDLKYADDSLGQKYSDVSDYFTVAQSALKEMYRQVGGFIISEGVMRHGIMQRGVLIRHLVMPGLVSDSIAVLDWIEANLPLAIVSLLLQYRPEYNAYQYKEINRHPTKDEFMLVRSHLDSLNIALMRKS